MQEYLFSAGILSRRGGAHKALPFAETAAETKLARFPVGAARLSLFMVSVFAVIIDVPVLAASEKDVPGERIRVAAHFQKRGVNVADCFGEACQSILKPACAHYVQSNMNRGVGQLPRRLRVMQAGCDARPAWR